MGQLVLVEFPGCNVVWIANNLSSCAQGILPLLCLSQLRREYNPDSCVVSLQDDSFVICLNNDAMELFLANNFPGRRPSNSDE
jgi:hypothetical protein